MKRVYYLYLTYSGLVYFLFFLVFNIDSYFQISTARLDALQLVLIGTLLEISIFVFEIPTGVLADVYGRRLSVICGVILMGAAFLLEGTWPVFEMILLAQVVWGLGYTFTSGALQAWLSDEIGEESANAAFVRAAQMQQAGAFLGVVCSTLLANLWIRLPYFVSGGLLFAGALLLIKIMPENGFKPVPRRERQGWMDLLHVFREGWKMVKGRPNLRPILWIGFFMGLYSEGFDRLWVLYLTGQFTFPYFSIVTWLGIIQACAMLCPIVLMEVINRRAGVADQRHLLYWQAGLATALVTALAFFSLNNLFWVAFILYVIIMSLREALNPLYNAWVNQKLDAQSRATVLSMSSQVDAIGQVAGGPLTGWVARSTSVRLGLVTSLALLSPVLGIFGKLLVEKQKSV
ncbi:MAG: MFS transporter [Anaerolineae bacterium]|nr:MFS transporter [Anaerolineae bacterium]